MNLERASERCARLNNGDASASLAARRTDRTTSASESSSHEAATLRNLKNAGARLERQRTQSIRARASSPESTPTLMAGLTITTPPPPPPDQQSEVAWPKVKASRVVPVDANDEPTPALDAGGSSRLRRSAEDLRESVLSASGSFVNGARVAPPRPPLPSLHTDRAAAAPSRAQKLSMSSSSFQLYEPPPEADPDSILVRRPRGACHRGVFSPMSKQRQLWDYVSMAMVIATMLVVPLRLAFAFATVADDESGGDHDRLALHPTIVADLLLDALCIIDVGTNFCFGYVQFNRTTAKAEIILDRRLIAARYLRRWCAVELLSIGVPFHTATERTLPLQWLSLVKLLRVERVVRVRARARNRALNAGRMPRSVVVVKVINIAKLIFSFAIWAHVCGCVYWFIGRIQDAEAVDASTRPWVRPWVLDPSLETGGGADTFPMWVVCFYWAMSTSLTIGYGDLTPNTTVEKLFVSLMMLTSSVFYACIFGQVTTLVDSLDQIQGRYQHQLQRFIEFASIYKLPASLRSRMYAHVHYRWQLTRGFQVESVLDSLPSGIRRDIQMSLLSSIVADLSIFASTPSNFVAAVVERFRTELIVGNEYVFTADEPGQCLYIIHTGRVDVITPEGVHVGRLGDGSYFGEIAILVGVRRTSSVRTACRCHFYKLSKDDFDEVLEGYPEMRERMVTKAMTRLRTILKVRTTSVSDAWAGRASRNAVEGVDERESIDGAEPAAERPAEALALNRWGEEKGDDVGMLEMSTKAGDHVADVLPAAADGPTAPPAPHLLSAAGGGDVALALAEMREELRSLRSLVAAGQPLGGRRSSDSHSESAMEISAALARPAAQTARGTRAPSRSPPPVLPEGRRRGGDRNSHRRKSISVLSHPAAAGIIE